MFDLSELRAQLRHFVEGLGWCAVMSEHDSFPIDPDRTTVENSRRNVRENADVFVMVVGAGYGSIDAEADKSVTNLEFAEARARGVPAYVFVRRDVLAQMRLWKANPEADYSGVVDTPRVFEFIDSFRGGGEAWTFEFATAEDIVNALRPQLAYLAQDSFELRQMARGQDRLLAELEGDALMLALRRDAYWEIRLFALVFEEELDRLATLRGEIVHRLASETATYVGIVDLRSWMLDRLHEVARLSETATAVVNDRLPQALGDDEVQADPIRIVAVARRLARVWEDSARWTLRCRAVRVDEGAERLVDLLSSANSNMLSEIWEFGHTLVPRIEEAIDAPAAGRSSRVKLTLTLTVDADELNEEIRRFDWTTLESAHSSSTVRRLASSIWRLQLLRRGSSGPTGSRT